LVVVVVVVMMLPQITQQQVEVLAEVLEVEHLPLEV
jgi:hypothetical protein